MRLTRRSGRSVPGPGTLALPAAESTEDPLLPRWLRRTVAYSGAALIVGALAWFTVIVVLRLALVTFSVAAALLLAALLAPLATRLCRLGLPSALAALASIVVLLGFPVGVVLLLYRRASQRVDDIGTTVTAGIDDVRTWLITGPLSLDPAQVGGLRNSIVGYLEQAMPSALAGATTALRLLGAIVLAIFTVFFLLKDGPGMWRWVLRWAPPARRPRIDAAGKHAWSTLTGYVRGTVVIALADATSIGAALLLLGVPLWLSLALLTFLGAFVPLLGATVAGAAAVLVTLVTNGGTDALIMLIVVLAVQQIEGNLLQPLVMGKAVNLHPLAILTAVTCGALLLGIPGAVIAVPVVAVAYQVVKYLAGHHDAGQEEPAVK